MRAIGYARVSTEEQAGEKGRGGYSLDAQEQQIARYCEARGWALLRVVKDIGSGARLDRPGLQSLLRAVEGREAEVAIVTALDRLSRRARDIFVILDDWFARSEVKFVSIRENFDCTTAVGEAMLGMASIFAQLERRLIAERTKADMAFAKAQGRHMGPRPFGWRTTGRGVLAPCPEEQAQLRQALALREQGLPSKAIAERMGWSERTTRYRLRTARLAHPCAGDDRAHGRPAALAD